MKTPFLYLAALLTLLPTLSARTFTSADGRTLEAEFGGLNGDTVTLVFQNENPSSSQSLRSQRKTKNTSASRNLPRMSKYTPN